MKVIIQSITENNHYFCMFLLKKNLVQLWWNECYITTNWISKGFKKIIHQWVNWNDHFCWMKFSEGFAGRGHTPHLSTEGEPRPLSVVILPGMDFSPQPTNGMDQWWRKFSVDSSLVHMRSLMFWILSHWVHHNSWSLSATLFWVSFMVLICGLPKSYGYTNDIRIYSSYLSELDLSHS